MDEQITRAETRPAPPEARVTERRTAEPRRAGARRPRIGIGGIFLLLLAAGLIGVVAWLQPWQHGPPERQPRSGQNGPQPVRDATAALGDMPIVLTGLGTVTPPATVTVRTQISGQLMEVGFKEGQQVRKGDFLAQIDPRPYQIALEQAQGQLARDQALLKNAQIDLARYQRLNAQDSIARQQVDTQQALVQQYQATIQTDQAQMDAARLNLTYCRIVAPTEGRVGLRQVDPGNYVQNGDTNGIVVITQVQPITVIFTLPEDELPPVMKRLSAGAVLPVTAYDRANRGSIAAGTLETVDNQIDTTTGTVKLRAVFSNTDGVLFPNQFVNVRLLVDTLQNAVIVPSATIQRGAPGTFVYLIGPDDTVSVRPARPGPSDGERTAVLSGLAAGDRVVTDGVDRLRDGAKIMIPAPDGAGSGKPADGKPADGKAGAAAEQGGRQGHRRDRQNQQNP